MISIQENEFEKGFCKMAAILFLHQCVNPQSIIAITDNMPVVYNVFVAFCVCNKAEDKHKPLVSTGKEAAVSTLYNGY